MTTTLSASKRTDYGKGVARKLRATGQIPAVLYGPEKEPVHLQVSPKELNDIFRHSRNRNTVVVLDIDGEKVDTLVREVQRHPVSRDLLHVDFYTCPVDTAVEVMVPVTTTGRPAGAVLGGRLRLIRRELKVRCSYTKIPENFVVDITPMNIGDMVKASEIPAPEGVEIVIDNDFNVLTVYGKRVSAKKEAKKEGKKK